jgi:hypothetical protein
VAGCSWGLLLTENRPGGLAKGNAGHLDTTLGRHNHEL